MFFKYDENKSKLKHGVYFEEAKRLWQDPYAFEIPSLSCNDEDRFLVIGRIDSINWTTIITYRGKNIRIISVRRSRKQEENLYESIRTR